MNIILTNWFLTYFKWTLVIFNDISVRTEELEKSKKEFQEKSKGIDQIVSEKNNSNSKVSKLESELLREKNTNREVLRKNWKEKELKKWRNKTWKEFIILTIVFFIGLSYILFQSNWEINKAIEYVKNLNSNVLISTFISGVIFIFNAITIKTLFGKYRNHSNIKSYIEGLTIPNEMRELK